MSALLTWLQDPTVQIVGWTLGGFGWVVGIVSGFLQVKGYLQQQRLEGAYETLFEQAKRDWRARYSQEQVEDLSRQIEQLEAKIAEEIPRQARRVFLEDQLHALGETIGQSYERYEQLALQLGEPTASSELPFAIKRSIQDAILPGYVARQRRQRRLYGLTSAIFALSFLPLLVTFVRFPFLFRVHLGRIEYPIFVLVTFVIVLIVCTYTAHKYLSVPLKTWSRRYPVWYWLALVLAWAITLPAVLLFALVSSDWYPGERPVWYEAFGATIFIALMSTGTLFLSFPSARGLASKLRVSPRPRT